MTSGINRYQLAIAIKKETRRSGRDKGPPVNAQLALILARKIAELYREKKGRCSFEELMDFSLNELEIRKEHGRASYRAAMGFYFGRHGNWARQRQRKAGGPKKPKSAHTPEDCIVVEKDGQARWLW